MKGGAALPSVITAWSHLVVWRRHQRIPPPQSGVSQFGSSAALRDSCGGRRFQIQLNPTRSLMKAPLPSRAAVMTPLNAAASLWKIQQRACDPEALLARLHGWRDDILRRRGKRDGASEGSRVRSRGNLLESEEAPLRGWCLQPCFLRRLFRFEKTL